MEYISLKENDNLFVKFLRTNLLGLCQPNTCKKGENICKGFHFYVLPSFDKTRQIKTSFKITATFLLFINIIKWS